MAPHVAAMRVIRSSARAIGDIKAGFDLGKSNIGHARIEFGEAVVRAPGRPDATPSPQDDVFGDVCA